MKINIIGIFIREKKKCLQSLLVPISGSRSQEFGWEKYQVLDSLVVRISACHVEGPGSIPGRGGNFFLSHQIFQRDKKHLAPRGIEPVTFALLARRSNQLS